MPVMLWDRRLPSSLINGNHSSRKVSAWGLKTNSIITPMRTCHIKPPLYSKHLLGAHLQSIQYKSILWWRIIEHAICEPITIGMTRTAVVTNLIAITKVINHRARLRCPPSYDLRLGNATIPNILLPRVNRIRTPDDSRALYSPNDSRVWSLGDVYT